MKVLHAAETIQGGVASVIRLLYAGRGDLLPVILVPENQRKELGSIPDGVVRTFRTEGRGLLGSIRFGVALLIALLSLRPDVVHLHSSFAGAIGRLVLAPFRFFGLKVVYCPHAFAFMMGISQRKATAYARVEKCLAHLCDAIVCVSKHERRTALRYGLPDDKLVVVRNGVISRPSQYAPPNHAKTCLDVLFVGRFDRQKGFDTLLNAMRILEGHPIRLKAVGDSVYGGYAREERSNIEYVGWVDHNTLDSLYREADVLLMPSRWEGFAMVPLEAMSIGVPVLASAIPALTEVVSEGVNGRLFGVDDAEALAEVLLATEWDAWRQMGRRARETVARDFTAEGMAVRTGSLYMRLKDGAKSVGDLL